MSRKEEVLVITVRQRRRRRGHSGMNSYLDSLSNPSAASSQGEDRRPEADEYPMNPHLEEVRLRATGAISRLLMSISLDD